MANTTSVENIIINNPSLADHPLLAGMIALYSEQLAAGYEPDPALLTEMSPLRRVDRRRRQIPGYHADVGGN